MRVNSKLRDKFWELINKNSMMDGFETAPTATGHKITTYR